MLEAEINAAGDVLVEGQHVGSLQGFRFTPDPGAAGEAAKTLNAAAQKALAGEFEARATRVFDAVDDAFALGNDGLIRWLGEPVGKIASGAGVLAPTTRVLADEQLTGPALEKVKQRLDLWLAQHVKKLLGPLEQLEKGEGLEGVTRGVAFQLAEELGVLDRARVAKDVKAFSQEDRAALRKLGVRFGAYHIYAPALLKPAPRALSALLWALHHGGLENVKGLEDVPHLAASGRTSFTADASIPKGFYRAAGFRVCGERVVRVDILERLADLIRPAIAYRPGLTAGEPPPGAADADGFVVTVAMTSLTGCSGEAFSSILKSLGYASTQRPGPAITVAIVPAAAMEPVTPKTAAKLAEAASEDIQAETAAEAPAAAEAEPSVEPQPSASEEAPAEELAAEGPTTEAPASVAVEAGAEAREEEATAAQAQEEPASEAAPAKAAPTEPDSIEIWRPQRHVHSGPRPREAGAHRQAHGQGAEDKQQQRPPRRDQRPGNAPGKEGRPAGKPRFEGRPPRDDARPRRPGGFAAPERRERQPDPDSPFAKLAALKAELEKKGK
jgi:ATP-dependent RNA helicase SUPV3L1/SUV3